MSATWTSATIVDRNRWIELTCACMEPITLVDIDRGYHRCGRLIEVRVSQPGFGAGVG